jgi:N-acetylglucosaminyldiphosphoundecaprenol N-acetyl-beta-D-mannosaminyltransferase
MTPTHAHFDTLSVNRLTGAQSVAAIGRLIARGEGGYVATPNVDHIVLARANKRLRAAYRGAALSLADGQPLLWMARLLGTPLPEKVSGSDLIWRLAEEAERKGWKLFLYGASPVVSMNAERKLREKFPRIRIVGRNATWWQGGNATEAVAQINAAKPDLVIVALGCPKQELWMRRHASMITPAVCIGLGGSLDFVAGAVRRAPSWMSRHGLEWLYRLAQEPRRLAYRYLVRDLVIAPIFAALFLRRLFNVPRTRLARVSN